MHLRRGRLLSLYFLEELGWAVIVVANTIASACLYGTLDALGDRATLLQVNLLFGIVYLPWQPIHLHSLRAEAGTSDGAAGSRPPVTRRLVVSHLLRSLCEHNRATDAASWGGLVGLTWMTAYWATLIPMWVHLVVQTLGTP